MSTVLTAAPESAALLAQRISAPLLVVGLCAAWCETCKDFESVFARLAREHPDAAFVWLDIEDDSTLAGDIDVENFPTLAIFREGIPVHFGVSLPHHGVVARLLLALGKSSSAAQVPLEVQKLPELLREHAQRV